MPRNVHGCVRVAEDMDIRERLDHGLPTSMPCCSLGCGPRRAPGKPVSGKPFGSLGVSRNDAVIRIPIGPHSARAPSEPIDKLELTIPAEYPCPPWDDFI